MEQLLGQPDTQVGLGANGMPAPKRARTQLTDLAVHPTGNVGAMASYVARATQSTIGGPMGMRNFDTSNAAKMSSRLPITARPVAVMFTSRGDFDYAKNMEKSHVFSIFDANDGVTRVVNLNRLNRKLRDDHETHMSLLRTQRRPGVTPADIGVGVKRDAAVREATHVSVRKASGLVSIEQFIEHVRYIGMMPISSKDENRDTRPGRTTLERAITVQFGGEIHGIMNIWGKARNGDRLVFEVTRINQLSEGSAIADHESFGPLQVVPVVHKAVGNATGSSFGPHVFWKNMQRREQAGGIVFADNIKESYCAPFLRVGSTDASAFDMYQPIRNIVKGDAPHDSVHWGPGETTIPAANGVATERILYKQLTPNVVIPVGYVDRVDPIALHGLSSHQLRSALMEPSGKQISTYKFAPIDVILTVNSR
jgi:hypothetical protein